MRGLLGTLSVAKILILEVLVIVAFVLAISMPVKVKACDGYGGVDVQVGGGAFSVVQPQYACAPQAFVQQQVYAQPVVQYQQAVVQQVVAQPVYRQAFVGGYAPQAVVVGGGYGGLAVRANAVAVDVGRARRPFGLRFRLNRAANVGASSVVGAPVRLVR